MWSSSRAVRSLDYKVWSLCLETAAPSQGEKHMIFKDSQNLTVWLSNTFYFDVEIFLYSFLLIAFGFLFGIFFQDVMFLCGVVWLHKIIPVLQNIKNLWRSSPILNHFFLLRKRTSVKH